MVLQRTIVNNLNVLSTLSSANKIFAFALEHPSKLIAPGDYKIYLSHQGELYRRYTSFFYGYGPLRAAVKAHGMPFIRDLINNRIGLMFHPGNTVDDTDGCVLPGLSVNLKSDVFSIAYSADALTRLINIVVTLHDHDLKIKS